MNGIQSRKAQNVNVEKQFAGCLGRMVNLFDLKTSVSGNRLLTDKPHWNGSMLSTSRSDVARIVNAPIADQIEDKLVVSELRTSSNKKANGTPMKTLVVHQMSKEVESKHNTPNVVAKLMGLDALPQQQSSSAAQRSHSKGYSRHSSSHSSIRVECWEQDQGFLENRVQSEVNKCQEQNECKDLYEIWQQSQRTSYSRDSSIQKGMYNENLSETKMALVHQKFMEAKLLATDEKLRQSKEFQDALEVLSTSRDSFLRFLQEPKSLFSQHLYDLQSIPPPPETKRITVLRPSKMVDDKFEGSGKKSDKLSKNPTQMVQAAGWERSSLVYSPVYSIEKVNKHPPQSTRIVVLKPSPGKIHDIEAVFSLPSSPSRISHGEDFYEEPEDGVHESREVAKEITRQMRENLVGHRRDETLLSSVLSNGYIGDESSCNKSEIEYAAGNLSDLEAISLTSRHSWDYINRFGSPYSSSSFSRASCSSESLVCREAKKRLSERWAMMALNGNSHEQRHVRRSPSTLGEMLALSDTEKLMKSEGDGINKELEPMGSTSCLASNLNKEECLGDSPKNLMRSKSLPVSSTASGARLNVDVSDPEAGKAQVPKELTRTRSSKSSLKGKVSSLFYSRTKKSSKEKSIASQSNDGCQLVTADTPGSAGPLPGMLSANTSQCVNSGGLGECLAPGLHRPLNKTSSPDLTGMGQNQGMISQEAGLSVAKPVNVSENQDQPSPISVLEPPFEEDDNTFTESSSHFKLERSGIGTEVPFKSNLIDKSPPIESIARTLSWDDSCTETATPYPLKSSSVSPRAEEEQEWLFLVQTLIQSAGLDDKVQSDTFFARWHSPESPLDPSLREKKAGNEKEPLHEAKRRQRRSNRKLVFDCVNEALVEITGYGSESDRSTRAVSCSSAHNMHIQGEPPMLVDHVWARMKEWFDGGDSNDLVVERVVGKEVVGKGWSDQMRLELDNLGKEIEVKLLEELVVDLTGKLL